MMNKVILITGCSTGIGRKIAEDCTAAGYTVAASARRLASIKDLNTAMKLAIDVTDSASIEKAVAGIIKKFGRIDVLVNNAGYGVRGVIEEIPDTKFRDMFDVNVLGIVRMANAVVPHMRAARSGKIINIGSIAGKLVMPCNGAYSSTKFALEGITEAMRIEVKTFGIDVILVRPGNISTAFMDTTKKWSSDLLDNPESPYAALYEKYKRMLNMTRHNEPGPAAVSKVVLKAIASKRAKISYFVAVNLLYRFLASRSDAFHNAVISFVFGIGRTIRADTIPERSQKKKDGAVSPRKRKKRTGV